MKKDDGNEIMLKSFPMDFDPFEQCFFRGYLCM
jgi:hypothetical protein